MIGFEKYATICCSIKELLHDFNFPLYPIYIDDIKTPKYEGRHYIHKHSIVKCVNNNFVKVGDYNFNKNVANQTKKFIINSSYYDNYTHESLGEYLRILRDYKDIDLLGLYNCFNKQQPSRLFKSIEVDRKNLMIDTDSDLFDYYIIKAKFNKEYTIAIDSDSQYDMCCILYNNASIESDDAELIKSTHKSISGSKFSKPFLFSTKTSLAEQMWRKEKDLKILLKLPKNIKSSIVVLEGDFTTFSVVDGKIFDSTVINSFNSKLSLLSVNDKLHHQFSDRLVEYILGNAITSDDKISQNIERVQDMLYPEFLKGYYGIWSDQIREDIFKQTLKRDPLTGTAPKKKETDKDVTVRSQGAEIRKHLNGQLLDDTSKLYETVDSDKTFRDFHNDLTYFVDKDIESILSLGVVLRDE